MMTRKASGSYRVLVTEKIMPQTQSMSPDNNIDVDGVFDILRAEIRRELLSTVRRDGPIEKEKLAEEVAERIQEDFDDVKVVLYHAHIPLLISWGVLSESNGQIGRGLEFDGVIDYLDKFENN